MVWRLSWNQFGKRQVQDFADEGIAKDAAMILEGNTTCNGLKVEPLAYDGEADLSGPRQLGDDVQGVQLCVPKRDPRWNARRRDKRR